jgi:hypothetical protein
VTNLCLNTTCNCTLSNNTNLNIICDSTPLIQLPSLNPIAFQTNVTYLRVSSSITNTKGPLITFPTNICSLYSNIAVLDLSSNAITGFLNTSELACLGSNLINVDFSYNNISDIDINFFNANRQLQTINLSHNNLITMPMIDGATFVNYPSAIVSMDFSYNYITNVDLWPLFVRTGK